MKVVARIISVCLLAVFLACACSGCMLLTNVLGVNRNQPLIPVPSVFASAANATQSPTPTPLPTPTVMPEPSHVIPGAEYYAAIELYRAFFSTAEPDSFLDAYIFPPSELVDTYYNYEQEPVQLYSINAVAVCDTNLDGVPELMLRKGESDQEMLLFTVENGVIELCDVVNTGNQGGDTQYALWLYQSPEGEFRCYSRSLSGTGAGNFYSVDLLRRSLTFVNLMGNFIDEYSPYYYTYRLGGCSEAEFDAAMAAEFDSLTLLRQLSFVPLGADADAALAEALQNA